MSAVQVGTFPIPCQAETCPVVIEVPICAEVIDRNGRRELDTWPDLMDVWSHAWAHVEGAV